MTPRSPKRGEIWRVDFNPTKGAEIQKQRPAVVISSDALGKLPLKIVAPLTGWKDTFENNLWHVKLLPTPANGLTKPSAADAPRSAAFPPTASSTCSAASRPLTWTKSPRLSASLSRFPRTDPAPIYIWQTSRNTS